MLLPSFHASGKPARPWSIGRAAAYGAGIGAAAALFRTFGPFEAAGSGISHVVEIATVAVAFALLCAGAAALRNLVARRLIWPELH